MHPLLLKLWSCITLFAMLSWVSHLHSPLKSTSKVASIWLVLYSKSFNPQPLLSFFPTSPHSLPNCVTTCFTCQPMISTILLPTSLCLPTQIKICLILQTAQTTPFLMSLKMTTYDSSACAVLLCTLFPFLVVIKLLFSDIVNWN